MRPILQLGTVLFAATACSLPPLERQEINCADGEVTRLSTGETFSSLADAVSVAHTNDHFCLGAGEFALDSVAIQRIEPSLYSQSLTIQGQGKDETTLVASQGYDTLLYLELDGLVAMEGLTIDGGRARLKATEVEVRNVRFTQYAGWERGFTVKGETISMDDVVVTNNQLDYASGLYISASELGTVSNLTVEDNASAAGYMVEFHGNIEWSDSVVQSNQLTMKQPGYDLVELFGPSVIRDVTLTDNTFNGPALRAYDSLDATGLTISQNESEYAAVLTLMGQTILEDSLIADNRGPNGAIGLYDDATVAMTDVNAGMADAHNDPCDLFGDPCTDTEAMDCVPQCLDADLGGAPQVCDAESCW